MKKIIFCLAVLLLVGEASATGGSTFVREDPAGNGSPAPVPSSVKFLQDQDNYHTVGGFLGFGTEQALDPDAVQSLLQSFEIGIQNKAVIEKALKDSQTDKQRRQSRM